MSNNTFLEGTEYSHVPAHNMVELSRKTFKYLGQMIATSVVHGGPGPQCLFQAGWITSALEWRRFMETHLIQQEKTKLRRLVLITVLYNYSEYYIL